MIPIATFTNQVMATFLLLESIFVGFKRHLFHQYSEKDFYLINYFVPFAALGYIVSWSVCSFILEYMEHKEGFESHRPS